MGERSAKDRVLKNVRKALLQKGDAYPQHIDLDSDVFAKEDGDLIEAFSGNFIANHGQFFYAYNEYHFADQFLALAEEREWTGAFCLESYFQRVFRECEYPLSLKIGDIANAEVSITGCDALISRTGSIVVSSASNKSRTASVFPPVHTVVAYRNQLFYDLKNYFATLPLGEVSSLPSMISIISGPSRTADIEKTLVLGAHGPKEIFVFFIDQEKPEGPERF
jgi:L-lactate dehydrogenase complex protein LldG